MLLAIGAGAGTADAQMSAATLPVQGLRFGALVPGAPSVISPADGERRAVIELLGTGSVSVSVESPPVLVSAAGARLPLHLGPGHGRMELQGVAEGAAFDPSRPYTFRIPPGVSGAFLYFGASVLPSATQAPGRYSGVMTVTIVVANTAT